MILRGASSYYYFSSPPWSSPTFFCPSSSHFSPLTASWLYHPSPPPLSCCRCHRPHPRGLPARGPSPPRPSTYSSSSRSDLRSTWRSPDPPYRSLSWRCDPRGSSKGSHRAPTPLSQWPRWSRNRFRRPVVPWPRPWCSDIWLIATLDRFEPPPHMTDWKLS